MDLVKDVRDVVEYILLLGAGIMAVYYGVKRIYNVARSVEKILGHVVEDKKERDVLAGNLKDHIKLEEDRDAVRDAQFIRITDDLKDVVREVRPNGGSSMKDILNRIANQMNDINTRLARVEQWKKDNE